MEEPRIVRHPELLSPEQQLTFEERRRVWDASFTDYERQIQESGMITEEDLRIVINTTDETFI